MADDKDSEQTSESCLSLDVKGAAPFAEDAEQDDEIFTQRAVTEAAYFNRDFGESELNDADNCPNFSIYSATSIDFTKDVDPDETTSPKIANADLNEECDENLVQMTDDEAEDNAEMPQQITDDDPEDNIQMPQQMAEDEPEDNIEMPQQMADDEPDDNIQISQEEKEEKSFERIEENPTDTKSSPAEGTDPSLSRPQSACNNDDDNDGSQNISGSPDRLIEENNKETEQSNLEHVEPENVTDEPKSSKKSKVSSFSNRKVFLELYDDSDWDEWNNEKTDEEKSVVKPNAISDIEKLTESISDVEDDRGYTPCQDELVKSRNLSDDEHEINTSIGIGGLETEMISEEEGNIFADDVPKITNKSKTLETMVEDGEIIEKNKNLGRIRKDSNTAIHKEKKAKSKDKERSKDKDKVKDNDKEKDKDKDRDKDKDKDKGYRKNKNVAAETFKKISSKDRNYRDKDKKRKTRSESRDKRKYSYRKKKDHASRKKEKRKDLEWYDVRNMISEKNKKRSDKDEYGRERRPTPSRSRSRGRFRSQSRSRSRRRKDGRTRSRGRSGYGRYHNSRSKSRSLSSPRSTSIEPHRRKRKSRSARRRTRSVSRTRNHSKPMPKSKSKSPIRKATKAKRKRSSSYQRDWTPSWSSPNNSHMSNSPNLNDMLPSPSWTPPPRENISNAKNLTVFVNNKEASKKKKEKRKKSDMKQKEPGIEKISKKRRRELPVDQPSKEVFASGDNILVSVSFNKNKANENLNSAIQTQEHNAPKRKNKNEEPEQRKRRNSKTKDKPPKANRIRRLDLANRKPIAIIDLDKSPFKELTPSPRAIIVLTDSESEEKEQSLLIRQERIHEELGSLRGESRLESPTYNNLNKFTNNTGPKTPPEPQINFSLQLKPMPKLRNVNLLYDQEEDENDNDDIDQNHINMADKHVDEGPHKGPNTPPEPPNSPPSSPDAYDPFEPTKSASQSPIAETTPNAQCSIVDKQHTIDENNQSLTDAAPLGVSQVPPPEDAPADTGLGTNTVEKVLALLTQRYNNSPEKIIGGIAQNDIGKSNLDMEAKAQSTANESKVQSPDVSKNGVTILSNVLLQSNMLANVLKSNTSESLLVYTSNAPISSTPIITTMSASRSNLFNSANNNIQSTNSGSNKNTKAQTRPSPIKSNPIKPMVKTAVIKPGIRPYMTNKVHKPSKHDVGGDADIESPYSPGSDDFDDLFEPPPTDNNKLMKNQKSSKSPTKKAHDFDNLFTSPSYKPSINSKNEKRLYNRKYKRGTKTNKTQVGVKIDDDQLKVLEELPSSAVEMQVKDKFMKKLNRQERVVEEVKVVLKPHYAKKHVTKEQYKDILRRAVPKICHNKSGEINPQRIHKLIEAYVKKARQSRKTMNI